MKRPRAGALTRSTVGTEVPDRASQAIDDALHWIWSWRVQLQRLAESTGLQGGTSRLEQRRSYSRASLDEHLLVVTGWNLARALSRAELHHPSIAINASVYNGLRLLRHLYEHWDETRLPYEIPGTPKKRAAAELATRFSYGRPWSIVYDAADAYLGGVVGVNELSGSLDELEAALLQIENETVLRSKDLGA